MDSFVVAGVAGFRAWFPCLADTGQGLGFRADILTPEYKPSLTDFLRRVHTEEVFADSFWAWS